MELKWEMMANDVYGLLTCKRICKFGPPFAR